MENQKRTYESSFTELAEFKKIGLKRRPERGNIIKARQVVHAGAEKVGVVEAGADQPTVIIHKTGDTVESAEFICKCGRSAMVEFDYGDQ